MSHPKDTLTKNAALLTLGSLGLAVLAMVYSLGYYISVRIDESHLSDVPLPIVLIFIIAVAWLIAVHVAITLGTLINISFTDSSDTKIKPSELERIAYENDKKVLLEKIKQKDTHTHDNNNCNFCRRYGLR